MKYQIPAETNEVLKQLGKVWVYPSEYQIARGHLHVLITERDFKTKRADL